MKSIATAHFFLFIIIAVVIIFSYWDSITNQWTEVSSSDKILPFLALSVAAFFSRVSSVKVSAKNYEAVNDSLYIVSLYVGQFGLFALIILSAVFPAELIIRYKHIKEYGRYRVFRAIFSNLSILVVPGYIAYLVLQLAGSKNRLSYFAAFFAFMLLNKLLTAIGVSFLNENYSFKEGFSIFKKSWRLDIIFSLLIGYLILILYSVNISLMIVTIVLIFVLHYLLTRYMRKKNLASILEILSQHRKQ